MKYLAALILVCCNVGWAGSPPQKGSNTPSHDYSKGVYLGNRRIRIFPDDPRNIQFLLLTSWIPGVEHKGFFRYQLSANVMAASLSDQALYAATPPPQGWGIPETIERLQGCMLSLYLYDEGGFVLQKIPIVFEKTVDDHTVVTGLSANDSSQMDLNNYQSFLSSKPESSWNIEWSCPKS